MTVSWTARVPILVLLGAVACSDGPGVGVPVVEEPVRAVAPESLPAEVAAEPAEEPDVTVLAELRAHPRVVAQAHDLARDHRTVRVALQRAEEFFAMIEQELLAHGLPRELAFVPMVESVFLAEARGRRAVGLWQFTASTARAYGLKVEKGLDERRDPEKSTQAAVRYLRDLHARFGSWELALAAYNAGPSRVRRAQARLPGGSYWDLSEAKLLPPITRRYVPKVIGSALLADEPERFGLALPDGLAAVAFSVAG